MTKTVSKGHSFFERLMAKRWLVYTLCYAIFFQQPFVIAADLVSLERAEAMSIKVPLSRSKEKAHGKAYKTEKIYCQLVDVPETKLRLSLSPDLEKLDSLLILFKSSDKSKVASLQKTTDGLALQILEEYTLALVSQDSPLPTLFVTSVGPMFLEAEKLVNPLTVHAASINFLKEMKIHGPVILWAKGIQGLKEERKEKADDREPITLTLQNNLGKQVLLEARGRVQTKGLKGNGTLSIFAGEFANNEALLLPQIQIRAHIENGVQGDLCGRESVFLEGTLKNKGFIRTRGDLVERIMYGGLFEHTETSRTFSLNSHKVEGTSYLHNGKVYSAGVMRVLTSVMTFGPKFHFRGNRFIGNARHSIEAPNPSTLFEALRYIEFKSADDLDNRARLRVCNFPFPFNAYFGDLTGLDEAQTIVYQKKSKELEKEQKYIISDEQGESDYGILFSSSKGTLFQAGDINTSFSDILLKAKHVGHDGITRSGTVGLGSVKVVAQSANLRGRIEASKSVEAHVTGSLTMDLFLKSPLTLVFSNSLDLSGTLNTSLIAKVAGPVRFLDELKAHAIFLDAPSLSVLQTPGSTAGPQEIGSLQASVSTFLIQKPLILSGPSWAHVESWFVNQSHMTINGFFEADMRGVHYLGSMDGLGTVSLKAPAFRDGIDLSFGKTKVQTKTIHVSAEEQDLIIDKSHTTDRQVSLKARSLAIKTDQTATGGLFLGSINGDFSMQGISLNTADQLLSLEAMGGDLNAQGARTRSGILSMRSSGNGYFGGGIFSAPQMHVSIAGLCDTSSRFIDRMVPVTSYKEFDLGSWGKWSLPETYLEKQRQTIHDPASFISLGTPRDGGRAYQYFNVGTYRGQGNRGKKAYYAPDGSYHVDEETEQRVVHHSDGSLTIVSHSTLDLAQADLRSGLSNTILLQSLFDMNLRNIHATGGRARVISERGNIFEHADVLTNVTHINRSGCGGDYTYQTTSQHQAQRAEGNIWNLFGGRQALDDGTELPTLLFQAGRGQSIISQASTLNVPKGLVMRIAPDGTIQQTTVTLSDTFNQHHQTWGKGYNNNFYEGWSHVRGVGGSISATAEVTNCFRLEETGYDRRIRDYHLEDAQEVIRRAAMSHYSAYNMASLSKEGDLFSGSGSAHHSQTMNAQYATPVLFDVGHYIERKNRADRGSTTTWEGPIHFSAKASTWVRDQVYKAIQQTVEQTSTSSVDNMSSFQPTKVSLPRFTSRSHPIDILKEATQVLGHANQALRFLNNLKSGNGAGLAHQILSQFTNFSSTTSEHHMRLFEMTEAAPFFKLGRTHFNDVSQISGVLAGMTMDSPTGNVRLFDVRAPLFERIMEARSSQTTDTWNPLTVSVGHSESWSKQSSSSTGSLPAFVQISGRPDLRMDVYQGDGVGIVTVPTTTTQDFTQRIRRVQLGDRTLNIPYLIPVKVGSNLPIIPLPTANRISLGQSTIKASSFKNESHQESGHSSWGFNGLEIALTLYAGGVPDPWMIANALSVGFGGEERHSYQSGTTPLFMEARGAPIEIEDLDTIGRVTVGEGIKAQKHHHTDVAEVNTNSHEVDRGGQMLEAVFAVRDSYNAVNSFQHNVEELFKPKPLLVDYGHNSRVLNEWFAITNPDDQDDSKSTPVRPSRASQKGNSEREPDPNPRRGRTRTREEADPGFTLSSWDQTTQGIAEAQNFVTFASSKARSSSPTTFKNKVRLENAETNYEAVKDQGFLARRRAAAELIDARQTYEDRIALRQNQLFRTRVMTDAAHYVIEHPYQAAGLTTAALLTGGALAVSSLSGALSLGITGGALGGLTAHDFRVQNRHDVLNIGASALTGAFAPIKGLSALYGARNVFSAAALTGVGLGGLGYTTGSPSLMVDGLLLTAPLVFGSGQSLAKHFFAKAPATENLFARVAANSNSKNTLSHALPMKDSRTSPITQTANQNLVRLFDVNRATGTHGMPSFFVRMSENRGSNIPRGGFSAGNAESSVARSSVNRSGVSTGPSKSHFIKRIDKQQAQDERMMMRDVDSTKEIPWSSKSVRDAVKSLEMGQTEVRVASRMEAEELLLGKFSGQGLKNTTGMRPTEAKNLLGKKGGTYHWDIGKNAYPHESSHLQIHDFEKYVIRIYFPD